QAPPRIITPPADRSVTEGEDATFTVDAEGSGLTYQWRRDGVDIPGAVTASYTLSSAPRSADGATFQVVVSNDAGSVTSTPATLSVALGVPVITTGPADQTVDDGAPAYFACVAEGSELAYQWQRDGADIPGAQDETYTLPAASLADDGVRFRCVVTSPAGSASAEATLSVLPSAPTIAAAPSDVSVTEGEAATFAVVAEGSAPLAYQWSRNGAPIDGASAANYTLPAASLADDGAVFAVTVSNASGEEARASATLRVELAPPRIVDSPTSVTVDEGEAVELSVAAEGSELAYQWERDGAPLEGATAATYTFTARYADRGAYCVVVTNGAGSVTSAAALVEVRLAPPTITTEPTDLSVAEGAPASFAVEASGAALSYQWEDDDGPIAGATEASFTLATTTLADDGRSFRVRVRNDAAEVVSRVAVLTVDPAPPRITSQPASLAVTEGEPASFAVVAEGTALTYQWFKDAVPLAGATDATLSVGATTLADAGVYHCEVSNAGATVASAQATLSVRLVPPVLTAEPAGVTVRDGEAATFTVAATGSDLSYRWQRFGVDVPGATSPTYTLTASYADDGASFVAIVSNSGGSVSSAPAVLRVLDEVAPELHLEGAPTRITEDGLLRLVGTATDAGVGLEGVTVRSDRFADQTFGATLGDAGTFEVEVPLEVGPNALTVTARDRAGNETTTPVTVTRELPLLPRIVITEPLLGLRTEAEQVTVAGRVETRLDRTEIRLSLAEQVAFPTATTGTEGVYEFRFDNVPLRSGRNVLTVQGQTPYGTVSGQTVVAREDPSTDGGVSGDSGATNDAPRIRLPYASAQLYRTTDLIPVRGTVSDDRCVDRVLVNGEPADQIGAGAEVSFEATLSFTDAGSPIVPIEIEAHDCDGESTRIAITAFLDDGPPEVVLTGIGSAPTITPVLRTPYPLSGTVRDPNIASFTVAGVSVPLMPTDDPSLWTFETRVPLARRVERTVVAEGRDLAGNRGRAEVVLRLDAELELSLEAPVDGDRLIGRGDTVEVPVRVRAPGLAPGDTLQATLDGAMERPLSGSGSLFSTSFTDIANGEEHVLAVTARSSDGRLLASATADFELVNEATLPLELVRSTPANGASGVEANQYVVLSFNRPVDPSLLQIEVRETVHGEVYGDAGEAADVRTASIVRRERIDREREPVPGSLQNLPGDQAVAFYPSRDLGYGGMVYVDVLHEGEEVAHFSFDVRPTPTLLMGFVADHELNPLPEIEVTIPELGLSTRTNRDGNFDFGFGWPADRALPSGTYRLLINPGRRISAYGAMDRLVTIRAEQLNRAGLVMLPWLDPESPFQPVASGERARLANGDLELDLTAASLSFPDGQRRGAVHTQLMERRRIGYTLRPPYHPDWGWSLQPGGIRVEGAVGVSMTMPLLGGSHEYLDTLQELHLLVALDQESLEIVPVGVLRLDRDARRVDAVRPVELDRLDYLAFARVGAEHQPLLARYASGELSLSELLAHLEASLP
ncbi:MAG TPA: immunoglobulin domain-containing protein, partial [Polyangiaceae bacterium LLY-WYZ-15_(1-7)]|nr:immunoglobulin domain-containing protein [Polyangiaceae bacterium LLY-WYZ-15_(1-7)]